MLKVTERVADRIFIQGSLSSEPKCQTTVDPWPPTPPHAGENMCITFDSLAIPQYPWGLNIPEPPADTRICGCSGPSCYTA